MFFKERILHLQSLTIQQLTTHPVLTFAVLFPSLLAAYWFARYQILKRRINGWPGYFELISPFTTLGFILSKLGIVDYKKERSDLRAIRGQRFAPFVEKGWNIISVAVLYPFSTDYVLADVEAIKQITHAHDKFPKPVEAFSYKSLTRFGKNIIITEGDEWRRHRKVSSPAFSEKNNRLVWETTVTIMNELFDSVWINDKVKVEDFEHYTVQIALMVLSVAGFGNPMSWASIDSSVVGQGHKLTFKQTVDQIMEYRVLRLATPTWILPFFARGRKSLEGDKEMKLYLKELVAARRAAPDKEDRWDILTNLIRGGELSEKTGEEAKLSPEELMANVWVYIIAGHETTANALCFTIILLAIFQSEQEKLYAHINEVIGDREPAYEDHSKLTRVVACFYESLRMYPIVTAVPKRAAEDTVITATRSDPYDPETANIFIKKGTSLNIHIGGVHYNPRYWKDPHRFMPERFLGHWNHDALLPFSAGPRACIGRKFSETEAVAALTLIISRYKVSLSPELQSLYASELQTNPELVREKLLKNESGFAMRPNEVPLVFTRRY